MVTPHPLEKALIGEVWTSEVYADLVQLCDFGSRFAGTESERAARDFIRARLSEHGLANVRLATFDFLAWARQEAHLAIVEPRSAPLPSALALVYSPDTPPSGLRAEVVSVSMGTAQDFAAHADRIAGRIVLASTDSPPDGPWIHRREKYGRAVAAGAAGFLFANHLPGMLAPTGSLRPGELAGIPALGLSYEDGFQIRRFLKAGEPVVVEMGIANRTWPAQFSHVIGEVPGQRPDEVVVVGAHYDGHDISQAAVDDASGTAILIEAARVLAPLAGQLRRTVRFEAYSAEELGVLGSTRYVASLGADELARVEFMLNLDGGALNSGRGLDLQGLPELEPLFGALARAMGYPLSLRRQIGTASDHFPYLIRGIPAASIFGRRPPGEGRGFGHTRADTLDKVDEAELRESAMVVGRLLLRLADHPEPLGRRRTQAEMRQLFIEHDLEAPLRAQGKWPFGPE
jgi:aminopeptidase YwaD